ncbi:MAG: hypothetical protein LBI15_09420 [Dysgonamonadaceae bacterium]|jgi:thiopeptide-type bacteriocin biosynthesis protein|nr:hypothetical protein [Dysgonamonadaceae bacterium]
MSRNFKAEFGFNERNVKQFNSRFREYKLSLESIIHKTSADEFWMRINKILRTKEKKIHVICSQLQQSERAEIMEIFPSFIHMMLNRLFLNHPRVHEVIIYDFLRRMYEGEIAKRKYN